jgi:transcriptional antiterminator
MIENAQKETTQRIGLELELYIEQDPEGKLKNSYPRSYPECNCQFLILRLVLKEPPDKFKDLAEELKVNYNTLTSHWYRKCEPSLQEIAVTLGYKQEPQP